MDNKLRVMMCGIPVSDPIKAFKFYTEVLGFKELQYMPEHKIAVIVSEIDPDGVAVLLEPNENPISKSYQTSLYEAGFPCITLGVKDVAAAHKEMLEKGIRFKADPITNDWGTYAIFEDGFGNYIQLFQEKA